MPFLIPVEGKRQPLKGPLTLTTIQMILGGSPEFIDLSYGDVLIVNSLGYGPINPASCALVPRMVHGPAILCSPDDIS